MYDSLRLFHSLIPNLDEAMGTIGVLTLILGILNAFFGYKLFKIILSILGFLIGAVAGYALSLENGSGNDGVVILWVVIGGIIGAVLVKVLYGLGIFLVVGAMSALVAAMILQDSAASLVIGVIGGIAGVIIDKYVIIVITALSGGSLAATGIGYIRLTDGEDTSVQVLGLIIGICGIVFQLWSEVWRNRDVPISLRERLNDPISGATVQKATDSPLPVNVNPGIQQQNLHCSNCGATFAEGTSFCGKCGFRIQTSEAVKDYVFCSQCGRKLPRSAMFCDKCGTAQKE